MLKVSQFLENQNNPFLLGLFYGRYETNSDNTIFFSKISFKKSQVVVENIRDFIEYKQTYIDALNAKSAPYGVWILKETGDNNTIATFELENDLNITLQSFINKLYSKVHTEAWLYEEGLSESKKDFIRGIIEPRGSVDTSTSYVTQDFYYANSFELRRIKVLDNCSVPYQTLNLNFRELQPDFVTGNVMRNTQFRINSPWFFANIGMINKYKCDIYENSFNNHNRYEATGVTYFQSENLNLRENNLFYERLNYYSSNVYGRELTVEDISALRQNLGFEQEVKVARDSLLAESVRINTPDECLCCKNDYNLNERTFTHKRTGRPYFEVHHGISFNNTPEYDDEHNMVKLCPVCHSALKKGIAPEEYQRELISKILNNAPFFKDFASHLFDTEDFDAIVSEVYNHLK